MDSEVKEVVNAENGGDLGYEVDNGVKPMNFPLFVESAALLTVWSVLVINEGAIRLVDSDPAAGFDNLGNPPRFTLFFGGLLEVTFGLFGLFVGVAALIFKWHNTNLTKLAILIQTIFGYYVFIVFVFLKPAYVARDMVDPMLPGLTVAESKFIVVLGILTSFHFCLALQGGQFVFFCRLICAATETDYLKQKTGAAMRGVFWNGNLAFSGLWTLITGGLVLNKVGGGRLDAPFISPPNIGVLPGMTLWNGILMLLYGISGIIIVAMKMKVPAMYYIVGGYTYLSVFLNFTIVQFGLLRMPRSGPVALHAGLVFMIVFLGPFFTYLASKEKMKKQHLQTM